MMLILTIDRDSVHAGGILSQWNTKLRHVSVRMIVEKRIEKRPSRKYWMQYVGAARKLQNFILPGHFASSSQPDSFCRRVVSE